MAVLLQWLTTVWVRLSPLMVEFLGTDVWVRLSPHNIRWCRVGKLVMMSPSKRAAGSCVVAVTGWIYLSLLSVGIHMGEVLSP